MRNLIRTSDGRFLITIDNPLERQTVIVEERSRNISIKGIIHTTGVSYSVFINDGHLSDLIAALQEIKSKSNRIFLGKGE